MSALGALNFIMLACIWVLTQMLECASITGDFDYILKVAAKDPESLEQFIMHSLLGLKVVRTTTTTFILRQMKVSGALPVDI